MRYYQDLILPHFWKRQICVYKTKKTDCRYAVLG